MKKLLLLFFTVIFSLTVMSQTRFVMESINSLPGQSVILGLKVYNFPPQEVYGLTVVIEPSEDVLNFECSGVDFERFPYMLENYSDTSYRAAWVRTLGNQSINMPSIQDYADGETFLFVQITPKYNTEVLVFIELADASGNIMPVVITDGIINIGIEKPKPLQFICGQNVTITGKNYGTQWLPIQKVCMISNNYDDGNSFVFQGQETGQYVSQNWKTPEGWNLPSAASYKEANVPSTKIGYKITTLSTGVLYPYKTSKTLYLTNSTTVNNWRYFYCPETPTKPVSDSNSPTTGYVRLVKQNYQHPQ